MLADGSNGKKQIFGNGIVLQALAQLLQNLDFPGSEFDVVTIANRFKINGISKQFQGFHGNGRSHRGTAIHRVQNTLMQIFWVDLFEQIAVGTGFYGIKNILRCSDNYL